MRVFLQPLGGDRSPAQNSWGTQCNVRYMIHTKFARPTGAVCASARCAHRYIVQEIASIHSSKPSLRSPRVAVLNKICKGDLGSTENVEGAICIAKQGIVVRSGLTWHYGSKVKS
jgi:hypothetical protein